MMLITASCSKDPFNENPVKPDKVQDAVYFASSLSPVVEKALRMKLGNITTRPDNARVIVVKSSELPFYEDLVISSWEEGKIIVEVEPEYSSHTQFWSTLENASLLTEEDNNPPLIIAIQRNSSFFLYNPLSLDEHLADIEIEEDKDGTESNESWVINV